jgi:uncharacterized protein (DUF488 family)
MMEYASDTIFSIGYAGLSKEAFLELLQGYRIQVVIDVRSNPYSQYSPEFNREQFKRYLKENGIRYYNYSTEFGARQTGTKFFSDEGFLDFEKFAKSDAFSRGMHKVMHGVDGDTGTQYRVAFMCAEKAPHTCHRANLVTRTFHEAGYPIAHILHDGTTITQEDVEAELLKLYVPDFGQQSFLGIQGGTDVNKSDDMYRKEQVQKAYKEQNRRIGFRPNSDEKESEQEAS